MGKNTTDRSVEIITLITEGLKKNTDTYPSALANELGLSRQIVLKYFYTCKRVADGELKLDEIPNKNIERMNNSKEKIIAVLENNIFSSINEIIAATKLSRQTITKYLSECYKIVLAGKKHYLGKELQTRNKSQIAKIMSLIEGADVSKKTLDRLRSIQLKKSTREEIVYSKCILHVFYEYTKRYWTIKITTI